MQRSFRVANTGMWEDTESSNSLRFYIETSELPPAADTSASEIRPREEWIKFRETSLFGNRKWQVTSTAKTWPCSRRQCSIIVFISTTSPTATVSILIMTIIIIKFVSNIISLTELNTWLQQRTIRAWKAENLQVPWDWWKWGHTTSTDERKFEEGTHQEIKKDTEIRVECLE